MRTTFDAKEKQNISNRNTIEERLLNLEIRMTEMHNLLTRIANKVQYWEEMEEADTQEEDNSMEKNSNTNKETYSLNKPNTKTIPKQNSKEAAGVKNPKTT